MIKFLSNCNMDVMLIPFLILIISVPLILLMRYLEKRKMADPINNRLPFSPTFLLLAIVFILVLDTAYILQTFMGE